MMMDQAHFGEYLLRQQMLHAASLSSLRKYLYLSINIVINNILNIQLFNSS